MKQEDPKAYWDRNIDNWGKFYLETSHSDEEFSSPAWLSWLYRRFVMPIESRLMADRYRLTMEFIERHVKPGMVVADVGCGTGIFSVEMLKRGARVIAIDISSSSLEATRRAVKATVAEREQNIEFLQMNVSDGPIPRVDAAIAMGVTPYVQDIAPFYENILAHTRLFYCLVLDPHHWANRVRSILPILNVRNLHCFTRDEIDGILKRNNFELVERRDFASGYLDLVRAKGN